MGLCNIVKQEVYKNLGALIVLQSHIYKINFNNKNKWRVRKLQFWFYYRFLTQREDQNWIINTHQRTLKFVHDYIALPWRVAMRMDPSHLHMRLALCSPADLGWKWTGIVEKHLFLTSTTECTVLNGDVAGRGNISTILSLPLLFSILTLAMDTSPTLIEGKTTTSFSRVTVPLFCFFPPTIGLVLDAGGWTSDLPFIRGVNRIF